MNIVFKHSLLLFILLFVLNTRAQKDENLGIRIILSTNDFSNEAFHLYQPPFKATAIYKKLEAVENKYPEQLMSSILCANSQEWVNYNTLGGEKEAEKKNKIEFQEISNINIEKTYFKLLSKITFTVNRSEMAIVKFYLYSEHYDKPILGAIVMKKNEGRWYKTSTPYTTNLAMILNIFKAEVFGRIITNNPENSIERYFCNKVITKYGLNCDKILNHDYTEEEKIHFTNSLNW